MSQHSYTEGNVPGLLFLLIYCQLLFELDFGPNTKQNHSHPRNDHFQDLWLLTTQGNRRHMQQQKKRQKVSLINIHTHTKSWRFQMNHFRGTKNDTKRERELFVKMLLFQGPRLQNTFFFLPTPSLPFTIEESSTQIRPKYGTFYFLKIVIVIFLVPHAPLDHH